MDEDFFANFELEDVTPPDDPPARTSLTSEEVLHWSSWVKPFPLPSYLVPVTDQCFDGVDDDVLMSAPPQMIAHIHRTAAQGGLQVVSPRQTPLSCMMERMMNPTRSLGDHVVGSIATPQLVWPTLDGDDLSDMLPDEPLAVREDEAAIRKKTRSEPLTRAPHLMRDPILACLIKGRAVIDILRRDDVMGDADALTDILSAAWGVDKSEMLELDAFTIGIDGPLLRHAIRADDVYPMVHAPIHQKLSVSVGSNEITRDLLADDSAIDWRRLRVFCEAVFLLSCSVEGRSLIEMRAVPPPGDPVAPLTREKILAFQLLPCTAWSFEPRTFSVYPKKFTAASKIGTIPREVLEALSIYMKHVRPLSYAMERGHKPKARVSVLKEVVDADAETISSSYAILARSIHAGGARGKNSSRAVRNLIYETIESASLELRLKLARYFYITQSECQIHLKTSTVPDSIVDKIASKFMRVGELIRLKVASECAMRGGQIEDWWKDISSQAPTAYAMMNEGTVGWSKVGMWLLFKSPSPKWEGLIKAVHFSALREAQVMSVGGVPLPPEVGSPDRILVAARTVVKNVCVAYSSYYSAVHDVAMSISDELLERNKPRSAAIVREGAYLWMLRARALRGTNVSPIAHDTPTPSRNHLRVKAHPVDILLVPAPYRAFESWKAHVVSDSILHDNVKSAVRHFDDVKISTLFIDMRQAMIPTASSVCTRYLISPWTLGADMERAWQDLKRDVERVIETYGAPRPIKITSVSHDVLEFGEEEVLDIAGTSKRQKLDGRSFFDIIADLDADENDWIDDILDGLDENVAQQIREDTYEGPSALRVLLLSIASDTAPSGSATKETVM